jgi:NAD(P)H-quinone oxidoreductase subunit 5
MTANTQTPTVGPLPTPETDSSPVPVVLTRLVWTLWLGSIAALAAFLVRGRPWELPWVTVDGLTVLMWVAVTFFSAIVHSYSRRYMAGSEAIEAFFARVFGFTLVVMVLVAADALLLFGAAWLGMGLLMAGLIGTLSGWRQAQAAASLARRYFLASTAALATALLALWVATDATTVSGVTAAADASPLVVAAACALVLAAMIQSALLPFQSWLLSSMTAPTPASALMHAGFVNAGGLLLVRFGGVVTVEPLVMLALVALGAASAIGGKLLKTVQTDVKGQLGCSTVGQMGFMLLQAGLGFFAAAITHLILHGFYKAYQFLSAGDRVAQQSPTKSTPTRSSGIVEGAVIAVTALAGGALFAALTGKGTKLGSGLLLVGIVVLMVLHAAREVTTRPALPATIRYVGVPIVALPAIALYGVTYRAVEGFLPVPTVSAELTVVHGLVAVAFLAAYVAVETGIYQRSARLYVALLNAAQPPTATKLTTTEDYNEY